MKKSVYSLVLMDDVIRSVDEEAYKRGTSRSNLINQILAQYFSCRTPEMRMQEIFESMSGLVNDVFKIQQQRSASLITLRTALDYKYRPTINYKVELERNPGESLGVLRMSIRTQSNTLIAMFNSFFTYRIKLESDSLQQLGADKYSCRLSNGSFTRSLLNTELSENETAAAISMYLNNLNDSIQTFFISPERFKMNIPQLEAEYKNMLKKNII